MDCAEPLLGLSTEHTGARVNEGAVAGLWPLSLAQISQTCWSVQPVIMLTSLDQLTRLASCSVQAARPAESSIRAATIRLHCQIQIVLET